MISSNTKIRVENAKGVSEIFLETKLMEDRRIFVEGTIDMNMANDFVKQMMYLDTSDDKDINLYINSTGGEVMAGLLMYDIIQSARNTINIYCIGQAYSMAAILLASGPKGHRFILPHSKVMIHEPLISNGIGGSATNIKSISDSILETKRLIIDLLKKHVAVDQSAIEEAITFDNFMKPKDAIAFGLCDKVVHRIY